MTPCALWRTLPDMKRNTTCRRCNGTGRERDERAFGLLMRSKRERAGAGLRAVASRMKMSASYLSELELGKKRWSARRVAQFVDSL